MASQLPPGAARPAVDGQGPDALQGPRQTAPPVWGDALRRQELEAPAARDHQGRGRPASGPRSQEQPAVRRDQPDRARPGRSTSRSTASGAMWKTASRNCITGWRWTAPVARSFWPTSSASCWTWPRYVLFQELRRRAARTTCAAAAGHHPAGAVDQAGGVGRVLRAPDRAAPAGHLPLVPDVAVPRAGRRQRRPEPRATLRSMPNHGTGLIATGSFGVDSNTSRTDPGRLYCIAVPKTSCVSKTSLYDLLWACRAVIAGHAPRITAGLAPPTHPIPPAVETRLRQCGHRTASNTDRFGAERTSRSAPPIGRAA